MSTCVAQTKAVPRLTDTHVNLAILQLDLHVPCPAWTLHQLERCSVVLRRELQQRREEVLPVPSDLELLSHDCYVRVECRMVCRDDAQRWTGAGLTVSDLADHPKDDLVPTSIQVHLTRLGSA